MKYSIIFVSGLLTLYVAYHFTHYESLIRDTFMNIAPPSLLWLLPGSHFGSGMADSISGEGGSVNDENTDQTFGFQNKEQYKCFEPLAQSSRT